VGVERVIRKFHRQLEESMKATASELRLPLCELCELRIATKTLILSTDEWVRRFHLCEHCYEKMFDLMELLEKYMESRRGGRSA